MEAPMNRAEAQDFLRTHHQAILGTIKEDGRPHLTSVLAVYDEGRLMISITETRVKYRHLRRDPRATALILGDNFWQYVVVEGTASLTHMPDALPELHRYYELASGGPHPDWEDYDRAMAGDRRVLMSLSIDRMYPLSD
jgi:PPOX class probable F420-dependent enzyme